MLPRDINQGNIICDASPIGIFKIGVTALITMNWSVLLILLPAVFALSGSANAEGGVDDVASLADLVQAIGQGIYEPAADLDANGVLDVRDIILIVRQIREPQTPVDELPVEEQSTDLLQLARVTILKPGGIHGVWGPNETILYDTWGLDGFTDIEIMDTQGTILSRLTAARTDIPQRNIGWPAYTDGWIAFQVEEPEHWLSNDPDSNILGFSGYGFFNNLWVMRADGIEPRKLTNIPIKMTAWDRIPMYALVNPQFSPDQQIMWTERYDGGGQNDWGLWQIKMADFFNGTIRNERIVLRAEDICDSCNYVNGMGFISENEILLAGNLDGQHPYGMDQYRYDIKNGHLTNLLDTPEHWEEGSCISPDKQHIVYQTNRDSPTQLDFSMAWESQPRTREWWIMDVNGSNPRQLTHFNVIGYDEYTIGDGKRVITAKCSFSPNGKHLVGILGVDHGIGDAVNIKLNIARLDFR